MDPNDESELDLQVLEEFSKRRKRQWIAAAAVVIVGVVVFSRFNWRCPSCAS